MGDKNKSRSKGQKRNRTAKQHCQQDGGPNPKRLTTADTASARKLFRRINKAEIISLLRKDFSRLFNFLDQFMRCLECSSFTVICHVDLDSKNGFAHNVLFSCESCPWTATMETSKKVASKKCGQNAQEGNTRMVTFARSLGRGHSALENFSLFVNSPAPISKNNYRKNFQKIHMASEDVAQQSMARAAIELKESP